VLVDPRKHVGVPHGAQDHLGEIGRSAGGILVEGNRGKSEPSPVAPSFVDLTASDVDEVREVYALVV